MNRSGPDGIFVRHSCFLNVGSPFLGVTENNDHDVTGQLDLFVSREIFFKASQASGTQSGMNSLRDRLRYAQRLVAPSKAGALLADFQDAGLRAEQLAHQLG